MSALFTQLKPSLNSVKLCLVAVLSFAIVLTNQGFAAKLEHEIQPKLYLQVGAFSSESRAKKLQSQVQKLHLAQSRIQPETRNKLPLYEVELGPFQKLNQAQAVQQQLQTRQIASFLRSHAHPRKPSEPHHIINPVARSQGSHSTKTPIDKIPSVHFKTQWLSAKPLKLAELAKSSFSNANFTNELGPAPQSQRKPQRKTRPQRDQSPARLWNLREVNIRSVIEEVSRQTGKNFIIDPRVRGKISIVSSTPIQSQAVYQMFLSALNVLGYSAISQGNNVKIVPSIEAKQSAIPIVNAHRPGQGDEAVVRIIAVKNVSAERLVPLLRPLLPQWGSLVAYGPSNVLIIAGQANNVSRVAQIIQQVDTTNTNGINIVPLHYATADDIVKTIKNLQTSNAQRVSNRVTLAAENQSNTILISGPKAERLKMRVLISQLDNPSASGSSGNTKVIYLHFLKAQDLVPILAGVAKSYGSDVGTVIGSITRQKSYSSTSDSGNSFASSNLQNTSNRLNFASGGTGNFSRSSTTSSQSSGRSNKPKVQIIGEPNTNSIIINAPPMLMRTLKAVINQLDIRPAQVLVEALIAEVDDNATFQLGIQWGSFASDNRSSGSSDDSDSLGRMFQQGIGIITGKGIHNLQGVIRALQTSRNADILSKPSVVVLDNHEAKIEVGTKLSVEASTYPGNANGGTQATPFTTFKQEKVALHLYVTPSISKNSSIQLSIDQGNNTLQNPENPTTTPIINISNIQTSVLVNSGDILVLGGLTQAQHSKSNEQVPGLGYLPVVGHLFNSPSKSKQKKTLMVFIRPKIIAKPQTGLMLTGRKYNFVRNKQLAWVRQQHYTPGINDAVLPPWHQHQRLPSPFQH